MSDQVYDMLLDRIVALDLEPGSRLPMDRLAHELGVSLSPLREALNRLNSQGLVVVAPYKGWAVSELPSMDEIRQLFGARELIETGAIRQAGAVDAELIGKLADLVRRMEAMAGRKRLDVRAANELDAQFHRMLIGLAGNRYLLTAFDSLHAHVQIARLYRDKSSNQMRAANQEHAAIVDAIGEADTERAVSAAGTHLAGTLSRLETRMKG